MRRPEKAPNLKMGSSIRMLLGDRAAVQSAPLWLQEPRKTPFLCLGSSYHPLFRTVKSLKRGWMLRGLGATELQRVLKDLVSKRFGLLRRLCHLPSH